MRTLTAGSFPHLRRPLPGPSPNLDLLRAVAVLLVLLDHLLETSARGRSTDFHPWDWALGRMGVLLFFVHTSYVLMQSLERHEAKGESLWFGFYIRRAFRI